MQPQNAVLGERVYHAADGSARRVVLTRCHPLSGRFVPAARFMRFEDGEGRVLGVAGVHPAGAGVEADVASLERLLEGAVRIDRATEA